MKWLGVLLLCGTAAGQTGPKFDVASVRPIPGTISETRPTRSSRRIMWATTLCDLTAFAWHVPLDRMSGLTCGQIFRIEAVTDHDATLDQMRQMLRDLLAIRFKQKAHVVSKDLTGIALTLGKSGMKVKESPLEENDKPYVSEIGVSRPAGASEVISHRATIDELADRLALSLREPVWNRTGLTGSYDYTFLYSRGNDPAIQAPSLEYALRTELGIEVIKKQTGPVDFLVIDSMETDPGEN
jgi:uncharacterized protein (TIGR03435 family)